MTQNEGLLKTTLAASVFLHHVWLTIKKLQDILKGKPHSLKSQNKHQKQTHIWQKCWNYQTGNKTTMIRMLRALVRNVDNMQNQMGNVSREIRTLRKNLKEMLEIKSPLEEKWRMTLMCSSLDWTCWGKNQWAWRNVNRNCQNWNVKRKEKNRTQVSPRTWRQSIPMKTFICQTGIKQTVSHAC